MTKIKAAKKKATKKTEADLDESLDHKFEFDPSVQDWVEVDPTPSTKTAKNRYKKTHDAATGEQIYVKTTDDEEDDFEPKRRETITMTFTLAELTHLYDLMGVRLSPDDGTEVSLTLAKLTGNELGESGLFKKVHAATVEADLPVDDDAFDYIVGPTQPPSLGIFTMDDG